MEVLVIIPKDINNIIPLIFEYRKKIKKIHLVYDLAVCEFEKALDLKNGLIKLNNKYNLNWEIKLYPIDEDKIESIKYLSSINFKYLFVSENTDVTIVVLFSSLVLKRDGIIYSYDKGENTYNVISKNKFENKKIKNNLRLEDYLIMLNYEIKEKNVLNDIKLRKKRIIRVWNNIHNLNLKNSIIKGDLVELGCIRNNGLDKSLLFGKILEEFIFWQLFKFDFDEIWLNVKIISEKIDKEQIENEIDILAIKNNNIFIFEVKSGILAPYKVDKKEIIPRRLGINIIYKLDSLMSIFGRYSKGFIINFNTKNKRSFSKNLIKRAEENNILIYEFKEFNFKELKRKLLKFFVFERVFLLGGMDLEMNTIKNILVKFDLKFFSKNLSWENAKLSKYKEYFNNNEHFYGIELIEDIKPPKHYTSIDHHNFKRYKLSSLEQIANLLNYKLSRKEKLIALNDRDYIRGMKKYGAKKEEIEKIRRQDRIFQGVSQQEELQAIKDIENAKNINGILVIKTSNEHFSPIADRIFPKEAIIYNDKEVNYYGKNVDLLVEEFKSLIDKKIAYFGKGFFGIVDKPFFYKDKIIKILRKKN